MDLDADPGLTDFAAFCALAEKHGPTGRPGRRSCAGRTRRRSAGPPRDRVGFHVWLQQLLDAQLEAANEAARAAGMPVGIVHDLAVGIDPSGADGWLLQDVLAAGVRRAPAGRLQPARPGLGARRVAAGPAHRDRVRRLPGHAPADLPARRRAAGGPRRRPVAAVVGAAGRGPAEGTYVHYDPEAMLGILALEAHRAGAVVIGRTSARSCPR